MGGGIDDFLKELGGGRLASGAITLAKNTQVQQGAKAVAVNTVSDWGSQLGDNKLGLGLGALAVLIGIIVTGVVVAHKRRATRLVEEGLKEDAANYTVVDGTWQETDEAKEQQQRLRAVVAHLLPGADELDTLRATDPGPTKEEGAGRAVDPGAAKGLDTMMANEEADAARLVADAARLEADEAKEARLEAQLLRGSAPGRLEADAARLEAQRPPHAPEKDYQYIY